MKFKYLVYSGIGVWGKNEISKEYFIHAVQRGDLIVDLEAMTYFDKDDNEWKPIEGDK